MLKLNLIPLLLLASIVSQGSFGVAIVGKEAPLFTLKDSSGKEHSLANDRGSYVVLEWYNKECPFVRKYYDANKMQALQSDYTAKNIKWYTINSSSKGKSGYLSEAEAQKQIKEIEKGNQTAFLLDSDGKVGKQYGAKTTPHMFIIDPKGVVVYAGAIDDKPTTDQADLLGAVNYVSAALDAELSTPKKKIAVTSTKPYGCSIKY